MSLAALAARDENDSRWLRDRHQETGSLPDVVRLQAQRWRTEPPPQEAALTANRAVQ